MPTGSNDNFFESLEEKITNAESVLDESIKYFTSESNTYKTAQYWVIILYSVFIIYCIVDYYIPCSKNYIILALVLLVFLIVKSFAITENWTRMTAYKFKGEKVKANIGLQKLIFDTLKAQFNDPANGADKNQIKKDAVELTSKILESCYDLSVQEVSEWKSEKDKSQFDFTKLKSLFK